MSENPNKLKCLVCAGSFQNISNEKGKSFNDPNSDLNQILKKMFKIFCTRVVFQQNKDDLDINALSKDEITEETFPFCGKCKIKISTLCSLQEELEKIQENIFKIVTNLTWTILDSFQDPKGQSSIHAESSTTCDTENEQINLVNFVDRINLLRGVVARQWSPIVKLKQLQTMQNNVNCLETGTGTVAGRARNNNRELRIKLEGHRSLEQYDMDSSEPLTISMEQSDEEFRSENTFSNWLTLPTSMPSDVDMHIDPLEDQVESNHSIQLDPIDIPMRSAAEVKLKPKRTTFCFGLWNYDKVNWNKNKMKFECHACNEVTQTEDDIFEHIRQIHLNSNSQPSKRPRGRPRKISCDNDDNGTSDTEPTLEVMDDRAHVQESAPGKFDYFFSKLGKTYSYELDGEMFKCLNCDHSASSHSHMVQHLRIRHNSTLAIAKRKEQKFLMIAIVKSMDGRLLFDGKWPFQKSNRMDGDGDGKLSNYKCGTCAYTTWSWSGFRKHVLRRHARPDHLCGECGKLFRNYKSFKNHQLSHTNPNPNSTKLVCPICGQVCGKAFTLNVHIRRCHSVGDIKRFQCCHCPKSFHTKAELNKHLTTHSNKKSYQCDECEKTFKQYNSLSRHKKSSHSQILPFVCPICDQRFTQGQSVNRHLKNVHNTIQGVTTRIMKVEGAQQNVLEEVDDYDTSGEEWVEDEEEIEMDNLIFQENSNSIENTFVI